MNRRNTDELIHDFVNETRDELPERVYAAVRREIDQSPQRIVLGPWRTPFVNNISRYAMAGAALVAVAVVAVLAFTVLAKQPPKIGGDSPSPTPTAKVTVLDQTDRGNRLPADTYSIAGPARATYTFTLGDGWWLDDIGSLKVSLIRTSANPDAWASHIVLSGIEAVYEDPCHTTGGATPVEQTVPALVEAMTHQTGFTASAPVPIQLNGASGSTFTIDNGLDTEQARCTLGDTMLEWRDSFDGDHETASGTHARVWVLDLGPGHGAPLVAEVQTYPWTTTAERDEAEQVITSMTFR